MINLLSPLYLWGAAAGIAALVLIHLLLRIKPILHLFPACRFISSAHEVHRRRRRIRNVLLLILRMLCVLAFSLVFARPVLREGEVRPAGTHTVIVVDTSYSMRLPGKDSDQSRFARTVDWFLKNKTNWDADSFTLVSDRGEVIGTIGISSSEFERHISEVVPEFGSTSLGKGLQTAALALDRLPASKKTLVILSDFAGPALDGWPSACLGPEVSILTPPIQPSNPYFVESIELIDPPEDSSYDVGIRVGLGGDFSGSESVTMRIGEEGKAQKSSVPEGADTVEFYDYLGAARQSSLPVMAGWEGSGLSGLNFYGVLPPRPPIDIIFHQGSEPSPHLHAALAAVAEDSALINMNSGVGSGYYVIASGADIPSVSPGSSILITGWGSELSRLQLEERLPVELYRYEEGIFPTGPPLDAEAHSRWLLNPGPTVRVLSTYLDLTPLLLAWTDRGIQHYFLNFNSRNAGPTGWAQQPNLPIAIRHLIADGSFGERTLKIDSGLLPLGEADIRRIWGPPEFPDRDAPGVGKTENEYFARNIPRAEFAVSDQAELTINLQRILGENTAGEGIIEGTIELWPWLLGLLLFTLILVELIAGGRYGE